MRAVIYIRVSTEEQAQEGFSLDAQERMCHMYAELRTWDVVSVYKDDGYSGRTDDRPALQKLLRDLPLLKPDAVIVHKIDRLARNLELMLKLVNDWDRRGIAFASAFEQMDFSTPFGKLMLNNLGGIAQWYSDNLSVETTKGIVEKARQGGWVGSVPYGYRLEQGRLVILEEEKAVIQEVFELYATGRYAYGQLADMLNARGLMIMDWRRRGRHSFGEYSIRSILDNKSYLGLVTCNGEEYQGQQLPIISQELWDRVVTVRKQRGYKGRISRMDGVYVESSPLNGLVTCAHCGYAMHWHPKSKTHCYYRCSGIRARVCEVRKTAQYTRLHEAVLGQVNALALPESLVSSLIETIERLNKKRQQQVPTLDRAGLESKLKRLARIYADGHLDDTAYERERTQLLELLRNDPTPALSKLLKRSDIERSVRVLQHIGAAYTVATIEERAALLREIFQTFWIAQGQLKAITPTPNYLHLVGVIGYMATPGRLTSSIYPRTPVPLMPIWTPERTVWEPSILQK